MIVLRKLNYIQPYSNNYVMLFLGPMKKFLELTPILSNMKLIRMMDPSYSEKISDLSTQRNFFHQGGG
jgi:hypothetical protein